jgi:hypothetical protein
MNLNKVAAVESARVYRSAEALDAKLGCLTRVKVPSLEVRARIATLICRGFGWMLIFTAVPLIGVGEITPHDLIGPIVGSLVWSRLYLG